MKRCDTCDQSLPLDEFSLNHGKPRKDCKGCRRAAARDRYWRNPEQSREYSRRYREEHPEWHKASLRAWGEKNADRKRDYMRAYYQEHKTDWRTGEHARRAEQLGAPGSHSTRDWLRLLNRYDGRCAYCEAPATQRDHIVPLTRGGTNFIGNIVPACGTCNPSKGAQFITEWAHAQQKEKVA